MVHISFWFMLMMLINFKMQKSTETLVDACKDIGLEVNVK